jgi:CDP-diacylglycerol--glycerol-3-phosphate 3-phosphatidyltransferase
VNELIKGPRRAVENLSKDWIHELMARLFTPLAEVLQRMDVSPNAITVLGLAFSLAGSVFVAIGRWPVAVVLIVVAGLMDGMDGLLARHAQKASRFGAFLDSVLDRWSDSALFIGLLIWYSGTGQRVQEVLVGVALASSLLVSYTRARAEGIGAQCTQGLLTRFWRIAALIAGLILNQMGVVLWIVAILSVLTAVQRIYVTYKYVRAQTMDVASQS